MTMDYSLSSFQPFQHLKDFQDFHPKRWTIYSLMSSRFSAFLKIAINRLKLTCYMYVIRNNGMSSFQDFHHVLKSPRK